MAQNQGLSPYERCVHHYKEGDSFWLEVTIEDNVFVYDIVTYGPEWVELSVPDNPNTIWKRWDSITPSFSIVAS